MSLGSLLSIAAAAAVQAAVLADQPEAIVVTGERVTRSVRETASSVDVVTRQQIEAASADRIEQILDLIPNVQVSSGGEGPTIRGQDTTGAARDLPSFLGGTRPRTTLIVDGRAAALNEFVFGISPMWDVRQVEVFRTPQTTTQGRNSIAGAIFVTTEDPTYAWEFRGRGIAGDAHTRQISAVGGGPLVGDQLAWRVAGDFRYSRTSSAIADTIAGADPNHDVYGLLRFKLLADPASLPGMRLLLNYTHSQSQMPQIEGIRPPFQERRDLLDGYGTFRTNVDAVTARLSYTAAKSLEMTAVLTGGDSRFRRYAPPGLGETQLHVRDWSGETVANWAASDSIHVVAGVSQYGTRLRQFINLSQLSGIGRFRDRQSSTGLFGEAQWSLTDRLKLSGGIRYQHDRQERIGALQTRNAPIGLDYDRSFDAFLPKASLAYDFTPRLRAGLLVQRAYNPGGTTLRFDTGAPDNFDAETLWDYELFVRAGLAGGLGLSGNLFYYDQHDAQRSRPIVIIAPTGAPVTFADLFNVPKARTYGMETTIDWRLSRRFTAQASLGLLSTKITEAGAAGAAFEGKQFQRSPKFSASAAVDWRPVNQLRLSAQIRHNSGYFSDDTEIATRRIDGWTKIDARAEWDGGKFRLFGYARNVFDKFYLTYLFNPTLATAGDPREIGIGVEGRL